MEREAGGTNVTRYAGWTATLSTALLGVALAVPAPPAAAAEVSGTAAVGTPEPAASSEQSQPEDAVHWSELRAPWSGWFPAGWPLWFWDWGDWYQDDRGPVPSGEVEPPEPTQAPGGAGSDSGGPSDDDQHVVPGSENPFEATTGIYGDPATEAWKWISDNAGDERATLFLRDIASQPVAKWIGGGGIRDEVSRYVSQAGARGELPVVVGYNVPHRDCGGHSSGGAANAREYRQWLRDELVPSFGDTPAVLVLEPDSLIHLTCLSEERRQERLDLLGEVVAEMSERAPRTWVYLDGGDGRHNRPSEMAPRLAAAGVADARGFAVNVSNYNSTEEAVAFGEEVRALLSSDHGIDAHYVIDTSRNGAGATGDWCNPPNRRLGEPPRPATGDEPMDALLWIKHPGTSDGDCGSGEGTVSGLFYPHLALDLMGLR
ncbi:endoglucanase [Actinoalloteichus sp. AHMU CJ021]|nr:endoglucanase [Actinoalloteichus sp. AHMU CJ021]